MTPSSQPWRSEHHTRPIYVEVQVRVRRDPTDGALAVTERGRDGELALPALAHSHDPELPALEIGTPHASDLRRSTGPSAEGSDRWRARRNRARPGRRACASRPRAFP